MLENELWRKWSDGRGCRLSSAMTITMSSAHSPTFPSLHLRHNSFSNLSVALRTPQLILKPSVASPTSQFIPQPFFHFSYVTSSSLNSPGEPPMYIGLSSVSSILCMCPQALYYAHKLYIQKYLQLFIKLNKYFVSIIINSLAPKSFVWQRLNKQRIK